MWTCAHHAFSLTGFGACRAKHIWCVYIVYPEVASQTVILFTPLDLLQQLLKLYVHCENIL